MNGFNKNPLIAVGTTGKMSCEKDISTNYQHMDTIEISKNYFNTGIEKKKIDA